MLRDWVVLFVRSNTERKVATACQRANIPYYYPTTTRIAVRQRNKFTVEEPLFRGYLFAEVTSENRIHILRTQSLVRFIVPRKPIKLLRELVVVRRLLRERPDVKAEPKFPLGQRVRVAEGAWMGTVGVVTQTTAGARLYISFEVLGQQVSVSVDDTLLEAIEEEKS